MSKTLLLCKKNTMRIVSGFIVALLFSSAFISCSKEVSQENGLLPGVQDTNNIQCPTCDYYPWCDGAQYVYSDTTPSAINNIIYSYSTGTDTIINNNKVYTSTTRQPGDVVFHNCDGNVTSVLIPVNASTYYTGTLLKSNEPVNATWTDTYPADLSGNQMTVNYVILQKSFVWTVAGTQYVDVIKVKATRTLSSPAGTTVTIVTSYYARGVGLIDEVEETENGNQISHQVLLSFIP